MTGFAAGNLLSTGATQQALWIAGEVGDHEAAIDPLAMAQPIGRALAGFRPGPRLTSPAARENGSPAEGRNMIVTPRRPGSLPTGLAAWGGPRGRAATERMGDSQGVVVDVPLAYNDPNAAWTVEAIGSHTGAAATERFTIEQSPENHA